MDSLTMKPEEIERESFRIIDCEAGLHDWNSDEWQVVQRAVHTSADFEYVTSMVISEGALRSGMEAIRSGCGIVTDTNMAMAGIGTSRIGRFGCRLACHVADADVAEIAAREGITRSIAAVRKAAADPRNKIFVIGNAPTALFELLRLLQNGQVTPALIIGLPVGFVGAEESKNALATLTDVAFITNIGRKGGSPVAAAIFNALAILTAGAA